MRGPRRRGASDPSLYPPASAPRSPAWSGLVPGLTPASSSDLPPPHPLDRPRPHPPAPRCIRLPPARAPLLGPASSPAWPPASSPAFRCIRLPRAPRCIRLPPARAPLLGPASSPGLVPGLPCGYVLISHARQSPMSHVIPLHIFQTLKSDRWNCNVCGPSRKMTELNYVRLLGGTHQPRTNPFPAPTSHTLVTQKCRT